MDEMTNDFMKEVYFDEYCSTCKYADRPEEEEPCFGCVSVPARKDSHKPICWKEKR